MSDKKKRHDYNKRSAVGFGRISWSKLESMLKDSGDLIQDQQLRSVEFKKDGLIYTTNKERASSK